MNASVIIIGYKSLTEQRLKVLLTSFVNLLTNDSTSAKTSNYIYGVNYTVQDLITINLRSQLQLIVDTFTSRLKIKVLHHLCICELLEISSPNGTPISKDDLWVKVYCKTIRMIEFELLDVHLIVFLCVGGTFIDSNSFDIKILGFQWNVIQRRTVLLFVIFLIEQMYSAIWISTVSTDMNWKTFVFSDAAKEAGYDARFYNQRVIAHIQSNEAF